MHRYLRCNIILYGRKKNSQIIPVDTLKVRIIIDFSQVTFGILVNKFILNESCL